MKVRVQILLVISGLLALFLPFFFMAGWLKCLIMFSGSLALNAVWELYAGAPIANEDQGTPLAFTEDDHKVRDYDCSPLGRHRDWDGCWAG